MKKINLIIMAAIALFAISCDETDSFSSESTTMYDVEGEKYVGDLTILGEVQEDIAFYIDENSNGSIDITMPEVSFMPGLMPNLDMALLTIPSTEDGVYYASESQMVGIYDRLPLINDVIQSISEVKAEMTSDSTISISFDCAISTDAMGDMVVTVTYDGLKDGYQSDSEDGDTDSDENTDDENTGDDDNTTDDSTTDSDEGFYVTPSSGIPNLLADAAVTYYKGDNTMVIDGFSFMSTLSTTTLPITGISESTEGETMILTGDSITVEYIFMTMDATGDIYGLTCEIIDGKAQMEFTITASMGGSGAASDYPCTFKGDITIEEGSYAVDTDTTPEFSLSFDEGFYVTPSSGIPNLLADATVTYYQGDNTMVIDGFSFMSTLSTTTLPITGISENTEGEMMILTADSIAVEYIFMTMDATSDIYGLTCEIIDGKAQMEFTITASMGGSGTPSDYPCTFNGEITIQEGTYGRQ